MSIPAKLEPKWLPTIEVVGDYPTVTGWRYLWLKYVSGFRPGRHCAGCLVGPYSDVVNRVSMPTGAMLSLDEATGYRHVYLCGVAASGGWTANLHLAAEPAPGEIAEVWSSTGMKFRIHNARRLPIPALPPGHGGFKSEYTTCRNWQYGVAHFGLRQGAAGG